MNSQNFEYECEGVAERGDNIRLLDYAIDLTSNTPWHSQGYSLQSIQPQLFSSLVTNARRQLLSIWKQVGLNCNDDTPLEQYHTLVKDQNTHLKAINQTKLFSVDQFPIPIRHIEDSISNLLNQALHVHNPFDRQKIFHYRVIRPLSRDNNPLHRDVWLSDYRDCINLYIPIAGSNENSSLIIASGSHLWPESRIEKTKGGAFINGQQFNVPAVTRIFGAVKFVRPNPDQGQLIIFSPYLIHGGAANLNLDKTRISIEIRLWKK